MPPDEIAAAGLALAVTAGGAFSAAETTALMTVEDTLKALDQAHAVKYRKPGTMLPAMSHN